nr:ribosome-associated translation inhibitor RaiA [bacterium]
MKISFYGKGLVITDPIRHMVVTKMRNLDWFISPDAEVQATLSLSRGLYRVEITVYDQGLTLRAEVATGDLQASIDNAMDKLEKQIDRHRTRVARAHSTARPKFHAEDILPVGEEDDDGLLVRTKRFSVKPMNVEEAIQQMELLGHTFFVYLDDETDSICVVYKRHDGNYGLLEPEVG